MFAHPQHRFRLEKGFSLVELLAVVSIISILLGAGAVVLNGKSTSLSTDSTKVFAAISEARQLAIASNTRTRFVIFTDNNGNPTDWQMRRYGILREQRGATPGAIPTFSLAGSLDDLGTGVYFQQTREYGKGVFANEDSGQVPGAGNARYAYIEFLPSGETAGSSSSNVFQLGRGVKPTSSPDETQGILIGVTQKVGRVRVEKK